MNVNGNGTGQLSKGCIIYSVFVSFTDAFIFKKGFRMSSHFQNVVLFRNVLSFSKCERFYECCFSVECYFRFLAFFCDWLSSVYIQCLVTVKCWFFFLSGSWGPITSLPVLWSSAESNERVSFLATFEHLSPFAASFTSHVMGLDMFCKKCFLAVIWIQIYSN